MASISSYSQATSAAYSSLSFSVVDRDCRDFPRVVKAFDERIVPIYGPQEAALDKIGRGSDRLCEMLYEGTTAKAIIVYKKTLNERRALELKTLLVLSPDSDSGKGYGSALISKVVEVARARLADHIEVTVSSRKPEALAFFTKKGFIVDESKPNFYEEGATEYFLHRDVRTSTVSASLATTLTSASS